MSQKIIYSYKNVRDLIPTLVISYLERASSERAFSSVAKTDALMTHYLLLNNIMLPALFASRYLLASSLYYFLPPHLQNWRLHLSLPWKINHPSCAHLCWWSGQADWTAGSQEFKALNALVLFNIFSLQFASECPFKSSCFRHPVLFGLVSPSRSKCQHNFSSGHVSTSSEGLAVAYLQNVLGNVGRI